MSILTGIAKALKGHECQMLIKRTGSEITLTGLGADIGELKLNIGSFSNRLIELVKATEVAIALDDSQYLLCIESSNMKNNEQIKQDCQRIRLMLIMAFNQLRAILGSMQSITSSNDNDGNDDLKQQLIKWIEYMSELHKQSISLLEPGPKLLSKGPKISQIMKYQGISEDQLQEAINMMQ
jgi:hypothetical protein